jgi:hypothetical protein
VDRLVLYKFEIDKEIIEDQNVGAAAVVFGIYIAAALVIASATAGTGSGGAEVETIDALARSLAFFGLGMVVLVLFSLFYELTTSFSIHDEIARWAWPWAAIWSPSASSRSRPCSGSSSVGARASPRS